MRLLSRRITYKPLSADTGQTGLQSQRSVFFVIVLLLLLSLTAACSSTSHMAGPLTAFSSATGDAAIATRAGIETLQNADLDKSAYNASKNSSLNEDLFPFFLSTGDVYQRLLVLDALSMYASRMKQLAGTDKLGDINRNFADLKTSLDSAAASIKKVSGVKNQLPEGVFEVLTGIGQVIVNLHVADIREKTISTALEKTDPFITRACELIASEYSGPHGLFYDQLQASYRTLQLSADDDFKSSSNAQAKLKVSREYGLLLKKKRLGLSLFDSIANSYLKIAGAHNAMLLQARDNIQSDDALNSLNAQIEYTKFIYSQLGK